MRALSKWLAGIAIVVVVLVGALRLAGPSLIMRFPQLMGIAAGIVDPIGPKSWVAR